MSVDVESAAKSHLDAWIHLLDLKAWQVTFTVVDEPIGGDPKLVADNTYTIAGGARCSLIRLYRPLLRSDRDVEEAVIHELLHTLDHGLGESQALHRFIGRLERPLRLARKRATQRRS